jgi:hypothetical protein
MEPSSGPSGLGGPDEEDREMRIKSVSVAEGLDTLAKGSAAKAAIPAMALSLARAEAMKIKSVLIAAAYAALVTGGLAVAAAAPATDSRAHADEATFRPLQALTYTLGSKQAVGYFEQKDGQCALTLMIAEALAPTSETALSAARVKLTMLPGQITDLASEEGQSIAITCGSYGGTVNVTPNNAAVDAL